jgi:hypothetical protein
MVRNHGRFNEYIRNVNLSCKLCWMVARRQAFFSFEAEKLGAIVASLVAGSTEDRDKSDAGAVNRNSVRAN